ncbi:hypothetical protein ACWIUD_06820 [Helicobacter sp. 23-1044]
MRLREKMRDSAIFVRIAESSALFPSLRDSAKQNRGNPLFF